MRRTRGLQTALAAILSLGTAGCLTITLPQYATPPALDELAAPLEATPSAAGPDLQLGHDLPTRLEATGPNPSASDAVAQPQDIPPAGIPAVPGPGPTPPSMAAPSPRPTPSTAPTSQPSRPPTASPTPTATPVASSSPTTVSPHPTNWLKMHGQVVTEAGGVDHATIATGISCATCHTTHRAADGSIPQSPLSKYTCYSCHNGPKGG